MPLVRRADSLLVVVDAQPGFFAYDALSEDDARRAAAAVSRITWMAGLATLLDIPAVVVCVAQSAVGLVELGFRAVVAEDATYTSTSAGSCA